jgi:hypothetical protein
VAGGLAAGFAVLVTSVALAYLARSAPHPEPRDHEPAVLAGYGPDGAQAYAGGEADEADDDLPVLVRAGGPGR